MESNPLFINEFKDAFFSLEINKNPGNHKISFNIVKKCFGQIYNPLKIIFQLSLEKRIFSDDLKTAKVTPVFKGGDPSKLQKYISISVLPCFSKIFDYIMYNCF